MFAADEFNFWAIGDFGFINRSTNGGLSWNIDYNNNFDSRLFGIHFTDINTGWIAGSNGLIARYNNPASNIIFNSSDNIAEDFRLFQNYPNPFNPGTILEFRINNWGFVNLKVFDILGKEIAVLVNENKIAGNYKINFDGSNIPSGVYFYSLSINGNLVDTRRMLLLK
ncbi:MAG: T9SS type A sorting domain-containing protein [Ignavibacteria bacterium]